MDRRKLIIITPLFFNNSSGSSIYYQLLTRLIICSNKKVSVISDCETGKFAGNYYALFPRRSGADKKKYKDVISYIIQNYFYSKIRRIIENERPCTVLVHSSFYNHIGLFSYFINNAIDRFPNIRWVADVRDHLIPPDYVSRLNKYNKVIACSWNIMDYLEQNGINNKNLKYIPVLQKLCFENKDIVHDPLVLKLKDEKYILYVGSIKKEKGVNLLLKSFVNIVLPQISSCKLVLVGLLKTDDQQLINMLTHPSVIYAGVQSRNIVYSLIKNASLCVNLSPIEGMPRVSLEALAIQRPTLLPPNVPEFEKYCPDFIVTSRNPLIVGQQMINSLHSKKIPSYPLEYHSADNVYLSYEEILFDQ